MASPAEIAFAVLITALILGVGLGLRARGERRRSAVDRRLKAGEVESLLPPPEPTGKRSRFDRWFDTAVARAELDASPAGVVAVMLLLAVAFGGGVWLWKDRLGLTALGIALGVGIPLAVVAFRARRYRWQMQRQIPDAYRMLAGSVRAGQTLDQAIEFYAARGPKPLADVFARCAAQTRLGVPPHAALKAVAGRVRLIDFDLLVSTVGLYAQTGGNLVEMLERLADSVRDRNLYADQFYSATAQARIVAVAIGAMAPAVLLVYLLAEPDHVQTFLAAPSGWAILFGCFVLEIVGVVWLWYLLRTDY